jgi:hypothetical protein
LSIAIFRHLLERISPNMNRNGISDRDLTHPGLFIRRKKPAGSLVCGGCGREFAVSCGSLGHPEREG